MSLLIADCPRCGAKEITFDLNNSTVIDFISDWMCVVEAFCICRNCRKSTVFVLSQQRHSDKNIFQNGLSEYPLAVSNIADVHSYVNTSSHVSIKAPEFLPKKVESAFNEGVACLSIGCINAAATMFRLCLDLATKDMLPQGDSGPSAKVARSLGLRIEWLLEKKLLPETLKELSMCIKDDGNDGAHEGLLNANDADDILDFTTILLDRIFTEPERIVQAQARRKLRHQSK